MARDMIVKMRAENEEFRRKLREAQKSAKELEKQVGGLGKEMGNASKSIDALSKSTDAMDRFVGGSIKSMAGFAAGALSIQTAMAAAQKAIASSQSATDEWGRTMQATERVVDSFFESLTQRRFDSFISGLNETIKKAREAYDAIDALGTAQDFNPFLRARYKREMAEAKYNIRAGNGDVDEWKKKLAQAEENLRLLDIDEGKASREAGRKLLESYTNSSGEITDMIEELIYTANPLDAKEAQAKALAEAEKLKKDFSYRETDKGNVAGGLVKGLANILPISAAGKVIVNALVDKAGPLGIDVWKDDEAKSRYIALTSFGQMSSEKIASIQKRYSFADETAERDANRKRENLETMNYKKKTTSSSQSKEYTVPTFYTPEVPRLEKFGIVSSMEELERELAYWQRELRRATTAEAAETASKIVESLQKKIKAQPIALSLNVPEEQIASIQEQASTISDSIHKAAANIEPIKVEGVEKVNKEVTDVAANIDKATSAFSTMGDMMQGLEDPTMQVMGIVMQAIANVAGTFAKSLAGTVTPWDWIAAAVAGTATMVSTIAAIKSATAGSFADGGLIKGGPYAGDAIPVMANAGEIVLNASQQQNIASQLQPRQDIGGTGRSTISGEQIVTVVNAYGRRSGRGEILK